MQTVIRAIEIMIQSIIDYFKDGQLDRVKFPKLSKYSFMSYRFMRVLLMFDLPTETKNIVGFIVNLGKS